MKILKEYQREDFTLMNLADIKPMVAEIIAIYILKSVVFHTSTKATK